MLLGQGGQSIEISLFQAPSLVEVAQQALADCQQVGPWLAYVCQWLGTGQYPQKSILAEIGGIPGIAQAPA